MKKLAFLLLAAFSTMSPMCSGATLECEDEEVYNEYVEPGSFTYKYENELSRLDYIRIEIITGDVKTIKTIEPEQSKLILVDGQEMWETTPVFISERSQVIIYRVECEYIY